MSMLVLVLIQVIGEKDPGGGFIRIQAGYLPIRIQNVRVVFEMEPWSLRKPEENKHSGITFRYTPGKGATLVAGRIVPWNTIIYGAQVEDNFIKCGPYYLPICFWNGVQVLYRENATPERRAQNLSTSGEKVRLCLLAPVLEAHQKYGVSGTFTSDWKDWFALEAEEAQPRFELRDKRIYYVDLPLADLRNAEFKFHYHQKGWFQTIKDAILGESLFWEYQDTNNRTIGADFHAAPGSRLYLWWGEPEVSETQMSQFLKLALSSPESQSLDMAMRSVEEVRKSICQVRRKNPTKPVPELRELHICGALLQVLSTSASSPNLLCVWLAVMQQKAFAHLRDLPATLKQDLISMIAQWPSEFTFDPRLGGVYSAARTAVLEEACWNRCPQQWLQAALQVILHGGIHSGECGWGHVESIC